jgi:hypothetical protein
MTELQICLFGPHEVTVDGELVSGFDSDKVRAPLAWTQNNRYIPELTCQQRERYGVEPLCE